MKVNKVNISDVRKEISQYISRNRLSKITIFNNNAYYGTMIFSKKTKNFGYSKLNKNDKKVDKAIGTLFAMYRYLTNLPEKGLNEEVLMDDIKLVLPKGYKLFAKRKSPVDRVVTDILKSSKHISTGYSRVDYDSYVEKTEVMSINGLKYLYSSQDLTYCCAFGRL